jgi:hypothetical protein
MLMNAKANTFYNMRIELIEIANANTFYNMRIELIEIANANTFYNMLTQKILVQFNLFYNLTFFTMV